MFSRFYAPSSSILSFFKVISIALPMLSSVHISAETVVGSTPAEFQVSGGNASYSIPIQIPSGRGGMQPDVSLNYTGGGNGVLGMGWSLGGLSSIHRCPASFDVDGFVGSINFDVNDRFCLDGQRLIPVIGTNGSVGTSYRVENDGYSDIRSYAGTSNHPSYFVARTKAGQIITFGGGNASLAFTKGGVAGTTAWSVSNISDSTNNNHIQYSYFIEHKTQYLQQISYPGGRVELNYEARLDKPLHFFLGNGVQTAQRLKDVTTYKLNTLLKTYRPVYQNIGHANRSHITGVTECDSGNDCYAITNFDHNYRDTGVSNNNTYALPEMMFDFGYANRSIQLGELIDVNGDGLLDYVIAYRNPSAQYNRRTYINNGSRWVLDPSYALPEIMRDYAVSVSKPSITLGQLQDVTGDGLVDFVVSYRAPNRTYKKKTYINTGSGWSLNTSYTLPEMMFDLALYHLDIIMNTGTFLDVNADGLADYVIAYRDTSRVVHRRTYLNTGNGWRLGEAKYTVSTVLNDYALATLVGNIQTGTFQDINNDGLVDQIVAYRDTSGVYHQRTYLNSANGWMHAPYYAPPAVLYDHVLASVIGVMQTGVFQDVNGDGLPDYVMSYRNSSRQLIKRTYLNNGDGWRSHSYSPEYIAPEMMFDYALAGAGKSAMNVGQFADMNGDGLVDYIVAYRDASGIIHRRTYLNNGSGWRSWGLSTNYTLPEMVYDYVYAGSREVRYGILADANGDGLTDYILAYRNPSRVMGRRSYLNNVRDVQLSSIEQGGNVTEIEYKPLTDASIHTKNNNAVFPVVDLQYSLQVVSSVTTSNGIDGTSTVNYHYEGLKSHVRGRGSYGYAKITETYPETGKTQETVFNQTGFPLTGNVDRVVEKLNGQIINESDTTYSVTSANGVYQVNVDQSVDKSYELNGDLITTVATAYSNIDAYGNVGRMSVTTTGNGESFTKITDSTYTNDLSNWYLGRLTETTVTHQAPAQADQQRRSQFGYDSATGLLNSQSIVSMATGLPLSSTSYQYDAYGHKTQVTVSAAGETNRTTTTVYNSEGKPTQTCNALNQCETYTYTPQGWLASTTGPNGITTQWEYDGFGRKTKEIRADGTQTTIAHHFATPLSGSPQCGTLATYAYTCTITHTTGSQPQITQFDRLGRNVRSIATGFDGRLIYSDTQYNALAQVSRVSRNYFEGEQIYWANSQYDPLGRVTQMDEPAPHGTRNIINTSYSGLTTMVTSGSEQRQKTTVTNAIGQVIHRAEEEGSYIDYTYTADGNLKTTTVAGDSTTTITLSYDEFGRKIAMDDPDMGQWSYTYNAFGQLISQTDAKNQTTTMAYDILGRMTSRTEAEGTSTWVYGDHTAPQGSIGKLLSETNAGITKTYFYDSFGRPDEVTTDITGEQSFSTQTLYDSIGRVSRTIYPGNDNFYTENLYNAHGFLEKVRGLRSNSEQYDLTQLLPLVSEAVAMASDFESQAQQLRSIGQFYQSRIDNYQELLDKQTIHFEEGTTAGLQSNRIYEYLHGSNGEHYIKVPDKYISVGSRIVTLIKRKAEYHYRVNDQNGQQSITRITASEFNQVESLLSNNGDKIKVIGDHAIACACSVVGHSEYVATVKNHQSLLGSVVDKAKEKKSVLKWSNYIPLRINGITIPYGKREKVTLLAPALLEHINNTLIELTNTQRLINLQYESYANSAAQLTVLAEQTLAAADNSFQYERTLSRGATAYTELVNDTQYTNYWRAIDVDASGRISAEVYGNGITNDYTYNQATGQLQQLHSSLLTIDPIRDLEYQYDEYQNVTSREDHANDIRETFEYDRLDRLTRTDIVSATYISTEFNGSQTQSYDALGNITHKSDVGHYTYGVGIAGPHAVTQVAGSKNTSYTYDSNGNMTSGDGRQITWSSFNKPTLITKGASSATFAYGPDRARYKKTNHAGHKTLYVGQLYEQVTKGNNVEEKHYIYANGQLVAEHIVSTAHGVQTRYLHKDALGSVDLVTDAYANVVDRRSFDAWGKLRNLTWKDSEGINNSLYLTQLPFTNKGFTGHENIQEVGLIHMNGRVYDATLARFLSSDPHIQSGALTQSYNRYSYVMNNPLKYTDPSGYFFKKLFRAVKKFVKKVVKVVKKVVKAVKPFIGVIAAVVGSVVCPACSSILIGAISGAAGAAANGGNIFRGALSGALTGGAGGSGGFSFGNAIGSGISSGVASVIQGGKFGAGFKSGFIGSSLGGTIKGYAAKLPIGNTVAAQTFRSALAGGTISELGGGKFKNGAASGAASYLTYAASEGVAGGVGDSGENSEPDIDTISDIYRPNKALGLKVVGNTLTGTIAFDCYSVPKGCEELIQEFKKINVQGTYSINLSLKAANDNDRNSVIIAGSKYDYAPSNMLVSGFYTNQGLMSRRMEIAVYRNSRASTAVHEMGHLLGIRHHWNKTRSVMSYSKSRRGTLSSREVEKLVEAYR